MVLWVGANAEEEAARRAKARERDFIIVRYVGVLRAC